MKRWILGSLMALGVMTSGGTPAMADDRPVVVELFTSQGCSACPPADALLNDLAERGDVIALALHVDYWDYLGWKDVFGSPYNSERQRTYASVAGRRMVYTPQMVINGTDDVVGNRPRDVNALIKKHKGTPDYVDLTVTRQGNQLRIAARAMDGLSGKLDIQLAELAPMSKVSITRGENAGGTFSYANVVLGMTELGEWDARRPLDMSRTVKGKGPFVVLIQRGGLGAIEAAQMVR